MNLEGKQYISEANYKMIWNFLCSNQKNTWFNFEHIDIYMRNAKRFIHNEDKAIMHIDIANIEVPLNRHVGIWTEYREAIEYMADELNRPIYLENVLNRHLRESLVRHGYKNATEYSAEVLCYRRMPKQQEQEGVK